MFTSKQVSLTSHFQRPGIQIGPVTVHKVRGSTGIWGNLKSSLGAVKSKEEEQGQNLGEAGQGMAAKWPRGTACEN